MSSTKEKVKVEYTLSAETVAAVEQYCEGHKILVDNFIEVVIRHCLFEYIYQEMTR